VQLVVAEQRERLDRDRGLLARLQPADEERVRRAVGGRAVGRERRVGGQRGDDDLLLRDVVQLDEVAPGQLGDREHAGGASGGVGNGGAEDQPVAPAHDAGVALEGEVLHRQHRRARARERQGVDEVREIGAAAAEQARHADRHPHDLAARRQLDGLDPVRHEVGPAGDRREPEVGGRRGGELAQ
jgi:hypothetical protein